MTSDPSSDRPRTPSSSAPQGRRWIGYVALVVVFAIACVALSQWQFARREEAAANIARVEKNYDAPPVPLVSVLAPDQALNPNDKWKPVVLKGSYLVEKQLLVRNRARDGEAGFDILSPFVTESGDVFVIDRGWVAGALKPLSSVVEAPAGAEVVVARLMPTEPQLAGQSDTAESVATVNLPNVAKRWTESTYLGAYGLLVSEVPAAPAGLPALKPELTEGNHLSYALQWIAFAVLGFVGLWWAIRNERRVRSGAKPKKLRVDRDAQAEDALLDS